MLEISIIITNYNLEKYIGTCIRSCLNQNISRELYEIIIVDDASTDNSIELIKEYQRSNPTIKIVVLEKNMGVAYASNAGIKMAEAPFIIRVDADDYINEKTLLFFSEILNWNQDIGFVYGDIFTVDSVGKRLERIRLNELDNLYNHGAGIMFRKSCLEAVGLYDNELRNCEDFDLIRRLFKNFDGYYLKLPLYRYRKHENNMTSNLEDREKWRKRVEKKHEGKRNGNQYD